MHFSNELETQHIQTTSSGENIDRVTIEASCWHCPNADSAMGDDRPAQDARCYLLRLVEERIDTARNVPCEETGVSHEGECFVQLNMDSTKQWRESKPVEVGDGHKLRCWMLYAGRNSPGPKETFIFADSCQKNFLITHKISGNKLGLGFVPKSSI